LPSAAKKTVKKDNENVSKALNNALDTLQQYNDALTKIQQRNTQAKAALARKGSRGRTVTLKIKFNDFEIITRSRSVPSAVSSRGELE
jgi:DNA polymerase-4